MTLPSRKDFDADFENACVEHGLCGEFVGAHHPPRHFRSDQETTQIDMNLGDHPTRAREAFAQLVARYPNRGVIKVGRVGRCGDPHYLGSIIFDVPR